MTDRRTARPTWNLASHDSDLGVGHLNECHPEPSAQSQDSNPHDAIWAVLAAGSFNSLLSGPVLRAAAADLAATVANQAAPRSGNGDQVRAVVVWPIDSAGERILGAALATTDIHHVWDSTATFPADAMCVLVSGAQVGPVGLADAAAAAHNAGAEAVTAAVLGGWCDPIAGIDTITSLADRPHKVA